VDLVTGQLHQLSKGKFQWLVDREYGWATDSGDRQQYDTLYQLDLASGALKPFFSRPGALAVNIVGINATGSLLVEVARQPAGIFTRELWLAWDQGSRLLTDSPPQVGGWIVDSLGVWLSGDRGLYLWNGDEVTLVLPSDRAMSPVGVCAS
jgi:hypothetical protein